MSNHVKYTLKIISLSFWLVLLPIMVFFSALENPSGNFDLVGYVASVYTMSTHDRSELHRLTYDDIKASSSMKIFNALTVDNEGYQKEVYDDPEALRQTIPFYSIRLAYVGIISAISKINNSVSNSTYIVSAMFAGISLILIYLLYRQFHIPSYFILLTVFPLGLMEISIVASPDSMVLFFSLLIFYSWMQVGKNWLYFSLILSVGLPLVRTDYVIYSVLICGYSYQRDKIASITGILFSLIMFLAAGYQAHNYGYFVLFHHQFIHLLTYPETAAISTNGLDYIKGYLFSLRASISNTQTILYVLMISLLFYGTGFKEKFYFFKYPKIAIPVLFFVLHMALFPIFFTRHFVFVNIMIFIMLYLALTGRKNEIFLIE